MIPLVDLQPRWMGAGGEGVTQDGQPVPERHGVGITFLCPCEDCTSKRTGNYDDDWHLRVYVGFRNPLDGGPAYDPRPGQQWERGGETFETLTLQPSIQRHRVGDGGCTWHGFVTGGCVTTV